MKISEYLLKDMPEGKLINIGLLCARLIFGLTLSLYHGWPTFLDFINGDYDYPDPVGIGSAATMALMGFAEFICAYLVAIGLGTRLAAIPIAFGFAVAFFIHHAQDPFNVGQLSFLYGSAFLVIALTGPGKYSLDYYWFK
jgi:putative oxidoreductase